MFDRLKRALVESFVGAIALGYLLARNINNFVTIFTSPVSDWITRKEYHEFEVIREASMWLYFRDTLPEVIRFCFLMLVLYVLLRWLYFTPLSPETSKPGTDHVRGGSAI